MDDSRFLYQREMVMKYRRGNMSLTKFVTSYLNPSLHTGSPIVRSRLLLLSILIGVTQPAFSQSEESAEYSVTFTGNWTLASTPGGVVSGAHFTTIQGGLHNSSVSFWAVGQRASSAMEQLAEIGATSPLRRVMEASTHTDETFRIVGTIATGSSTTTFTVKRTHPLVTFGSMIGPSPDWFVGLTGYSLLDSSSNWVSSVTVNLYPYDAGTEDGNGFSLSNPATSPQGVIQSIRGVSPFSNEPMATISFTRRNALPPPSQAPSISAIELPPNASQLTNADSVVWLITFNEAVRNVTTDDFVIKGTTANATSVSLRSGSTTQYEVRVGGGNLANLDGSISLEISSSNDITNGSNVALDTTLPSTNETYVIDNSAPLVVSVSPTRVAQSPFTLTITFNEALQQGSFADTEDVSSANAAVSSPTGSGSSYRVTVTPTNPSQSAAISITIPAGAGTDLAGNASGAYKTSVDFEAIRQDDPATVMNVTAISSDGLYHTGEVIEVGVTFSRSVTVTGTPSLELQFDGGTRTARYRRGSGSRTLVFSYRLEDGDATAGLGYVNTQSLNLAGGSIVGLDGRSAQLKLPSPGSNGSLSSNSRIRTSGERDESPPPAENTPPVVIRVVAITEDGLYHTGEQLEIVVTFSNTVVVTGTPGLSLQFNNGTREASYVRGSGSSELFFTYTLTNGDVTSDLAYVSAQSLTLNGASIVGPVGQAAGLVLPSPGSSNSLSHSSDIATSGRVDAAPSFGSAAVVDHVFMMNQTVDAIPLPSATGGDAPLQYILRPSLPAGLVLNEATNVISGTPTLEFDRTVFSWTATDLDGDSDTLTFSIMVLPQLPLQFPSSASIPDQEFLQNDAIDAIELPAARGGVGDLSYSLSPELPMGLMLDGEAHEITGTPTEVIGETNFTWQVTDIEGATVSLMFSITVIEDLQPEFDASSIDKEQIHIQNSEFPFIALPSASGGNGQLTYTLESELPPGLVFDSTAFEIGGFPTTPQMRTELIWKVTDEDGDTATFSLYITVLEDLMPSFAQDNSVADREYITDSTIDAFQLPTATGGNGLLSYDLTPGLPEGLELDATSFEISGTPTEALQRTQFTWTVQDVDGDTSSMSFYLTVIQDTQPMFSDQVADKVFIVDTPIDSFTLPEATGGNGDHNYEFNPALPSGLSFDANTALISGTPTMEAPSTTYSWTVMDIDGDSATISFAILVQPAAPKITGTISNVRLTVGGGSQTIDARGVIEGTVASWQVAVADPNIATASVSTAGALSLTPRVEGQTTVTVSASNVTDSVQIGFSVNVVTDTVENEQIDAALALQASAVLSGAMNVFKKRSRLHSKSNSGAETSAFGLPFETRFDEVSRNIHLKDGNRNFNRLLSFDFPDVSHGPSVTYGNDFVPMNFTHTTTKWSLWGAVDLQNFSSDGSNDEIDGSLSSLYLGADLAINENTFAGLAVAQHGGSSSYEFSSDDATGEGEIDTTLMGFYPYLQAGDGHRFSMFLVGGFGSGDSEIARRHANVSEPSAAADLSLFAGGFDYVILRRASLDLAIVGDAGVATITTEADSGVLANRERSSSKSSIGSSVSFNHQVEGGSLVTSADVRFATGADDDESRSGFELGANLNYLGEHLDFMLDGRMSSRSGDSDSQRSSLSARFRYKANADGAGLTLIVRPHLQHGSTLALDDLLDASNLVRSLPHTGFKSKHSIEGEIGFGIWTHNETTLVRPSFTWQRFGAYESVVKVGTYWDFGRATESGSALSIDVQRNLTTDARNPLGVTLSVDLHF